jgi:hypothetical protein
MCDLLLQRLLLLSVVWLLASLGLCALSLEFLQLVVRGVE